AVGGDGDALEPAPPGLLYRPGAFNALVAQALDHLGIVDDIADRSDAVVGGGGIFNDIERATDSPAIAEFLGDDDLALAGGFRGMGPWGRGRSRCHSDLPVRIAAARTGAPADRHA